MGSLAKSVKQKDLVTELVEADTGADKWLEEQKQSENFALNFKEPPVELGKYMNTFCNRNEAAYKDYKNLGMKELARSEF